MKKSKGLRSDNRVQVTLTIGRNEDGSIKRKSFYGATKTEAIRKRDEYKLKAKMGLVSNDAITVDSWVDICLTQYRQNVNEAYKANDAVPYHRLQKAIGRMRVADVREIDLQRALNEVHGKSFSTVNKYYQAIRFVFDKARRNKVIFDNPAENLQMPKSEKGSHRALERWESDCIIMHWNEHRCGTWAMLMLLCGLRRSEMMGLAWENIDMVQRMIHVRQVAIIRTNQSIIEERAKTDAGKRSIPICEPLWQCLDSTPENLRHGLVCTMSNGGQISSSGFKRGWDGFNLAMQRLLNNEPVVQQGKRMSLSKKIDEAAMKGKTYKLFSVRAHDLRHTFATALYDAGIDVKSAQYYLGHADIRMTLDLYTHLSRERKQSQQNQFVSFMNGWQKQDVRDEHIDEGNESSIVKK